MGDSYSDWISWMLPPENKHEDEEEQENLRDIENEYDPTDYLDEYGNKTK